MVEITVLPGEKDAIHTHPEYIEYILESANLMVTYPGKKTEPWTPKLGKAYYGKPEPPHSLENIDSKPFKCLIIEMKDRPYMKK